MHQPYFVSLYSHAMPYLQQGCATRSLPGGAARRLGRRGVSPTANNRTPRAIQKTGGAMSAVAVAVAAVLLPRVAAAHTPTAAAGAFPVKYPGWVGPFHSSAGGVWGGENVANGSSLWEAFQFGTSCIENSAGDEGYTLQQSIEFHCGGCACRSFTSPTQLLIQN